MSEEDLSVDDIRESLCDLLKKWCKEAGVLGVLIERQRGMLVAAFTYNIHRHEAIGKRWTRRFTSCRG